MITILSCTGCRNKKEKYPYDYIGFYDTKTRQYINAGDSKDKISEILGDGFDKETITNVPNKTTTIYCDYNDDLSIRYEDGKAEMINIFNSFKAIPRYELPGGITVESMKTY